MEYQNIPQWLKKMNIFCVWKNEKQEGNNTKVPYSFVTGYRARSNYYKDFGKYEDAIRVVSKYSGIGFKVSKDIAVIDLDKCVDEDGNINELAKDIIKLFKGAYIEYSPSKTGVHIIIKLQNFQFQKEMYYIKNSKLGAEVYVGEATNRFMTLTGNFIEKGSDLDMSEPMGVFLETYMLRQRLIDTTQSYSGECNLTDEEVIQQAKEKYKERFIKLLYGDFSNYPSQSEADFHFCTMLASICNGNRERINSVYEGSGLMREKWNRPQNGSSYGEITMDKAIAAAWQSAVENEFKDYYIRPADFSDSANAEVFARVYKDCVIYTDGEGFGKWDGKKFDNNEHKVTELAMEFSKNMLEDALSEFSEATRNGDEAGQKKAKEYIKHAKYTRSAPGIKRMLELTKPYFYIKLDDLDHDSSLLNTQDGIIDLRTGKCSVHDPKEFCTKVSSVAPSMDGMDIWIDFIKSVTGNNEGLIDFLQGVAGMALIGKVYQEVTIFAFGKGRNGKSTFFNVLARVMGDYAGTLDVEVLTTTKQNKGSALATLRGKRLVISSEMEECRRLATSTLKAISSTDMITAEKKYKSPESFTPSHTLVLFTNFLPRVGSNDNGTWRRILVCPFTKVFDSKGAIQNYADVIYEKAGGAVLTWAIEGAKKFYKNGCCLPSVTAVDEITDEYRKEEDWLSRFLEEECVIGTDKIGARELYMAFRRWSLDSGEYVRRENEFSRAMEAEGFETIKPKNKKHYLGITLKDISEFLA